MPSGLKRLDTVELSKLLENVFRNVNIALIAAWAVLAIVAIAANFDVPIWITAGLCAIAPEAV